MRTPFKFVLFLFVSLLCCFSLSYAADPALPTPVGRVIWIKGSFTAEMANKEERKLQKMSVIYLKDTLITGPDSQAQIAFTDGTLMTFAAETKFFINKYAFNPKDKKGESGSFFMNLIEGGFRTITGIIAKRNPNNYEVETPVATIGVRGTDYQVMYRKNELATGAIKGEPCVKNNKDNACLNPATRYAIADGIDNNIKTTNARPEMLGEDLKIVPASIDPFTSPAGKSGGSGNNFCVSF